MDHATLAWAGGVLGGVLGTLGGVIGTYFSIKNTNGPKERSYMIRVIHPTTANFTMNDLYFSIKNTNGPKERSFMVKFAVVGWITLIIFLVLMLLLPNPYRFLLWIPFGILLPLGIRYGNGKQQEIRKHESDA